jgi:hypothetical protein
MARTPITALLLGFALVLSGCAARSTEPTQGTTFVRIERTACFGSCPVYTLTIYATGFVKFEGQQYVKSLGIFTDQIQPSVVATIFAKAEAIGFWSLADSYRASREVVKDGNTVLLLPPTDLPTCYVTVSLDGRTKRIQDYWNAPEGLHELEQLIDNVGGVSRWVKTVPANNATTP